MRKQPGVTEYGKSKKRVGLRRRANKQVRAHGKKICRKGE